MTDSQFEQVKEMLGGLGNELVLLTAENAQYVFYSSLISIIFCITIPFILAICIYFLWRVCLKYCKAKSDEDGPGVDMILALGSILLIAVLIPCSVVLCNSSQMMIKSCFAPKILMMDKILDATKN